MTTSLDAENQALDLTVKSGDFSSAKQDVALDLSMSSSKRHKSPKTVQAKQTMKRRRSSLDIDYTVKFGNYGLAGMPRTKRQMSLHTRKKEEEEEKLAKKLSMDVDGGEAGSQRSVEDLVHAEILMSLQSAPEDVESDSSSSKTKGGKGKKAKAMQKKQLVNLEKVIDDVARRGRGSSDSKVEDTADKDKEGIARQSVTAFRCGLCLRKFDDASVLSSHVEEHKQAEKASPIIRLKADPVLPVDNPGVMYIRQKTEGNVHTIWKCQISSSTGSSNVYMCRICQARFDSIAAITEHEKVHRAKADDNNETAGTTDADKIKSEFEDIDVEVEKVTDDEEETNKIDGETLAKKPNEKVSKGNISKSSLKKSSDISNGKLISDKESPKENTQREGSDNADKLTTESVMMKGGPDELVVIAKGIDSPEEIMDTSDTVNEAFKEKDEPKEEMVVVSETQIKMPEEPSDETESVLLEAGKGDKKGTDEGLKETGDVTDGDHVVLVDEKALAKESEERTEKVKRFQCNVPAFLEVSESAEGLSEKEGEEADRKSSGPDFVNCGICNRKLKLEEIKAHLESHESDLESNGNLFEACIICKKMICSKDMNEHLKSHSVLELSLAKNILVHNQNQLKKKLVIHKQQEKDLEDKSESIKMFVCNLCDKGFEDCDSLAEHVEKHLKAKFENAKPAEADGNKEAGDDQDSGNAVTEVRVSRKRLFKPSSDKTPKKAKLTGVKEEGDTVSAPDSNSLKSTTAQVSSESESKKNSILAAALSSAPKYATSLPKTVVQSESTDSSPASVCSVQPVSLNGSPAGGTDTPAAAVAPAAVPTTTVTINFPNTTASTAQSSEQQESPTAETASAKDPQSLKLPFVFLKANSETGPVKSDTVTAAATSAVKGSSFSYPFVLVRQDNQEVKLVPVNLCSTGNGMESSAGHLKLTSPVVNTSLQGKKSPVLPIKPVTMVRPPILYAPVPTAKPTSVPKTAAATKATAGAVTETAVKIAMANPFPVSLIPNQSIVEHFQGKSENQSVAGMPIMKDPESLSSLGNVKSIVTSDSQSVVVMTNTGKSGEPASQVKTIQVQASDATRLQGKSNSQNIIAKLLDSKGKLASQNRPALIVKGKVNEENSENVSQAETMNISSLPLAKSQTVTLTSLSGVPSGLPLKFLSDPTIAGSLQSQPLLIFKRCPSTISSPSSITESSGASPVAPTIVPPVSMPEILITPDVKSGKPPVISNKPAAVIATSAASATPLVTMASFLPASAAVMGPAGVKPSIPIGSLASPVGSSSVQLLSMLQQYIVPSDNQSSVASSTQATSPKPTFNLVFAPQASAVSTTVTGATTTTQSVVISPAQLPVSVSNVGGQSQSLMLVCKGCNQSLDSLGLMGSHICPKTPTAAPCVPLASPSKKNLVFNCSFCPEMTFTDHDLYAQHMRSHGNTASLLACPLCQEIFTDEESVSKHFENKHPKDTVKCKYCEKTCVGKVEHDLHVLFDHPWQCNKCFHRCGTQRELNAHVMLDYNTVPPLRCTKCGLIFPSLESIVTHSGKAHPEGDSILSCTNQTVLNMYMQKSKSACSCTCKICDSGFTSSEALMRHVLAAHFTKVIFMCGICRENKQLPSRASIYAHKHFSDIQKQGLQFCYHCKFLFSNKFWFSKHMSKHKNQGNSQIADSTKSKLKSVLQDKAKSFEADGTKSVEETGMASDVEGDQTEETMEEVMTEGAAENDVTIYLEDTGTGHEVIEAVEGQIPGTGEALIDDTSNTELSDTKAGQKDDTEGMNTFECNECKTGLFRSKYQLRQHKVLKHMYPRSRTTTSYYQHVIENLKRPKGFECGKCERRFERQSSLLLHQRTHGSKQLQCKTKGCRLKFESIKSLREHQRKCQTAQNKPKRIGLGPKGVKVMDDSQGIAGVDVSGEFQNVYVCQVCEKDCGVMSRLKQHLLEAHRETLLQCARCHSMFFTQADINSHTRLCCAEGTKITLKQTDKKCLLCCGLCGLQFDKIQLLKEHVAEHTDMEMATRSSDQLSPETENTGGGECRAFLYACAICHKAFTAADSLLDHVAEHSEAVQTDAGGAGDVGDTTALGESATGTDSDAKTGNKSRDGKKMLNAVVCNGCRNIVYFEEDKLCESVLNHTCGM